MLAAIGMTRPARLKAAVLAVVAISLVAAIAMVVSNASAAFFLLPFRAWELGLGAALAFVRSPLRNRWLNEGLAVAGLAMILYAIKFYNDSTPFPGTAALLPCVGAGLLILTGSTGTFVAKAMSLRPILLVGKTSYSLYLWHWPVIVFSTIGFYVAPTPALKIVQIMLSLALGWVSWRYVEQPFRVQANRWRTPHVLLVALMAMAVSVAIASVAMASKGLPARFSPEMQRIAAWEESKDTGFRGGTCFQFSGSQSYDAKHCLARTDRSKPALLLLGDSHGAHLYPGLARQSDKFDVLQATRSGCFPVEDPAPTACDRFFNDMLTKWIPEHRPAVTIIAGRWRAANLPLLEKTLADPRVRAGNPVLIGPIPQYVTTLPRLLIFAHNHDDPAAPSRMLVPDVFATDVAMRRIAAKTGTPYISLVDLLCPSLRECRVWARPGVPLQFDYGHLTVPASQDVIAAIMPRIEAAMHTPSTH